MLCYYRHSKCDSDPGEDQDTDTADAEDMLGGLAYKHLRPADQYSFIASGDTEVDTTGQNYRTRFQARDVRDGDHDGDSIAAGVVDGGGGDGGDGGGGGDRLGRGGPQVARGKQ